jgi:hypothetical protein
MKKQISTIAAVLTVGLVAGCGGGGSSSVPATSAAKTTISGAVADGYLVGATVFLDKNANYQLDAGEPFATTDANGAYTLQVDPADMGKYPLVAMATKGVTIDKDSGAAIPASYLLSMPKESVSGMVSSNFISPMSSQLREMMETGTYTTVQQAMDALRLKLGMPAGTNMLADYLLTNNSTMHTAAQNMASLMGSQMAQVFVPGGSGTVVDVNRYRGMMGSIFSQMSSIRGANAQAAMTNLTGTMTTVLASMPLPSAGQPYRNMSTAFRGGMMGGTTGAGTGVMTGGTTVSGGGVMTGGTTVSGGGMMGL